MLRPATSAAQQIVIEVDLRAHTLSMRPNSIPPAELVRILAQLIGNVMDQVEAQIPKVAPQPASALLVPGGPRG